MTKEQKKAIEKIKRQITIGECEKNIGIPVYISDLKTILSILEEHDKVIDLMAEQLAGLAIFDIDKDETLILGNKEEVKQYYKQKSEQKCTE